MIILVKQNAKYMRIVMVDVVIIVSNNIIYLNIVKVIFILFEMLYLFLEDVIAFSK